MNTDFDYELSDDCEEDSHIQDVSVPTQEDIDIVLSPATAKKYLVDGEPLPDKESKLNENLPLISKKLNSDEGNLSDGDFAASDEILNDHDSTREISVESISKENLNNENGEFITPDKMKDSFITMANTVPENVLFKTGQPSIYERPPNDPARLRASGAFLAAFAVASYKTLFPGRLEELLARKRCA